MPTTMLTGTTPANLPNRPITFFLESEDVEGQLHLAVTPEVDCRRPRPGMLIIPAVDRPLTLTVESLRGGAFGNPATVHLTAVVTVPGSDDHDRVVLPVVSVAGLQSCELIHIRPAGHEVALSRPSVPERLHLSALGDASLSAARMILGAPRLDESHRVDVDVTIDCSASMLPAAQSGRLASAVELLTGVIPLFGAAQVVTPRLMSVPEREVTSEPSKLGDAVVAALAAERLTTGFPTRSHSAAGTITFVITDSVPADDDLDTGPRHYVVLANSSAAGVLSSSSSAPVTVVADHPQALLADPALLRRTVEDLLSSITGQPVGGTA